MSLGASSKEKWVNGMMRKDNNGFGVGLLVFASILIISITAGTGCSGKLNSSEKECISPGCHNARISGSNYCDIHKRNSGTGTRYGGTSPQTYTIGTGGSSAPGTTGNRSNASTYSGSGSGRKPSGSTTKPRTYNTLNNDPADYDDPEDYADDAWEDDFDDWGDAYDYWEDY